MTQKVEGLREILLRKSCHDEDLHTLIKFMDKEILAEYALESLEKMAMNTAHGGKSNTAFQDWSKDLHSSHGAMIHDALSHHATRLKSALKAGDSNAAKHHANKFIGTMNAAMRAAKHSPDALKIDAPDFKMWDQNAFPKIKEGASGTKRNDYVTQAKGWHSRAGADNKLKAMLMGPHWSYGAEHHGSENKNMYDKYKGQPYPLQDVKINGKYLHIDDTHEHTPGNLESHEFDTHPIHGVKHGGKNIDVVNSADHALTPEQREKILDSFHEFHGTEEGPQKQWIKRMREARQSDPEFANRGLEPSSGLGDILDDTVHSETGEGVEGAWSKLGHEHGRTWDDHEEHGHKGQIKEREARQPKQQKKEAAVDQPSAFAQLPSDFLRQSMDSPDLDDASKENIKQELINRGELEQEQPESLDNEALHAHDPSDWQSLLDDPDLSPEERAALQEHLDSIKGGE